MRRKTWKKPQQQAPLFSFGPTPPACSMSPESLNFSGGGVTPRKSTSRSARLAPARLQQTATSLCGACLNCTEQALAGWLESGMEDRFLVSLTNKRADSARLLLLCCCSMLCCEAGMVVGYCLLCSCCMLLILDPFITGYNIYTCTCLTLHIILHAI